jgi:hypothetical protein
MQTAPLTPAQRAALRRARELAAELAALTAAVRAHVAGATPPTEACEGGLEPGELRRALDAALAAPSRRPRWADMLDG